MPKKYPPVFQNHQSRQQTVATLNFDAHYAKLGVIPRWDWQRYVRLSIVLQLTPAELASLILLKHSALGHTQRSNRFPGPVCLLLTLIEAQALKKLGGDIIENAIPKHDSSQTAGEKGLHV